MMLVTGGVPSGDDFYTGRVKYIGELRSRLSKQEVAIIGPRRTGKTSIIQAFFEELKKEGKVVPIYINLESCSTPYDIITEIAKKMCENNTGPYALFSNVAAKSMSFMGKVKSHFNGAEVTASGVGIKINLRHVDTKKLEDIGVELKELCGSIEKELVLALDELPEAIWKYVNESNSSTKEERIAHIGTLLSFFRDIRQTYAATGKLRIIYSGSINFVETLKTLGFGEDHNDLSHFSIPFLTPTETVDIANQLVKGEGINLKDPSELHLVMNDQFGYTTPYYVQLFIEKLKNISLSKGGASYQIEKKDLVEAYQNVLETEFGPEYFYRRVETYHTQNKDMVLKILKFIANNQNTLENKVTSSEDIYKQFSGIKHIDIDRLLRTLYLEDFFQLKKADSFDEVDNDSNSYYFESKIIMKFWVKRLKSYQ